MNDFTFKLMDGLCYILLAGAGFLILLVLFRTIRDAINQEL